METEISFQGIRIERQRRSKLVSKERLCPGAAKNWLMESDRDWAKELAGKASACHIWDRARRDGKSQKGSAQSLQSLFPAESGASGLMDPVRVVVVGRASGSGPSQSRGAAHAAENGE